MFGTRVNFHKELLQLFCISLCVFLPSGQPSITLRETQDPLVLSEGQARTLLCVASGNPKPSYTWRKDSSIIQQTSDSNYTITSASKDHAGNYTCTAEVNTPGLGTYSANYSVQVIVRYRPVVQFPADHPKNLTLAVGERATFTCKTIGNPPTEAHRWQFNGVDIQGESCSGCTSITLTKASVSRLDEGWYSCIGTNSMGDGPPARAQLLIKHKPTINVFLQSTYTVNETNNVTMACGAEGVPEPTVTWKKTRNQKIVGYGEKFTMANTKESDDGRYICIASNELGLDAKEMTLNVQTRPTITTSTPEATNIPGGTGEEVKLTCVVSAKPSAKMSWKRDLNGNELSSQNDNKVKSISNHVNAIEMTLTAAAVDEEFYCVAVNLLGNDTQKYRIRERGPPDPPIDVKLIGFTVPNAKTVSVKVSWTPGYSGGFSQQFSIYYRKKGSNGDFIEERAGNPDNNMGTVKGLSPNTEYEFLVQATNERGKSQASVKAQVTTPASAFPPDRGVVSAVRSSDDSTVIIVKWKVTDVTVTKLRLEIQKGGEGRVSSWQLVPGASDISESKTEFKVENLKADEKYRFRMDMRRPGEATPVYVESNIVPAIPLIERTGRPTITTSGPETTNIPGATGEKVKLTCIVSAKPPAKMSWKRDLNGNELSSQNDNKVNSISQELNTIKLTVTVTAVDEEFYCVAVNLPGNDTEKYRTRERGAPDPPIDVKLVGVTVPNAKTVSVNVSWTPGYSGGFPQEFSIHYRKKGSNEDFIEEAVGNPENNVHTVKGLSPNTEYEFVLQASNERGKSQTSARAQVMTPASAIPPDRGVVSAIRNLDDPTVIIVTWKVTDAKVTKLRLEIQKGGEGRDRGWRGVPGASDLSKSKTEFKVENLKADEKYRFRMDMRRPGEATPAYVESNMVSAIPLIKTTGGLSTAEVSGIIVAIPVVIIALSVCILLIERQGKARKKRLGETAKMAFANVAVEICPGKDNMTLVCDETKDGQDQEA